MKWVKIAVCAPVVAVVLSLLYTPASYLIAELFGLLLGHDLGYAFAGVVFLFTWAVSFAGWLVCAVLEAMEPDKAV